MGAEYLVDSNVVIDLLNGKFGEGGKLFLFDIYPVISIITQIEIFSKKGHSDDELNKLKLFTTQSDVLPVDQKVAEITIQLRLLYKIKLL